MQISCISQYGVVDIFSLYYGYMKRILLSLMSISIMLIPYTTYAETVEEPVTPAPDEFYKAVITKQLGEEFMTEYGPSVLVQSLEAEMLNGPDKGSTIQVSFEIPEGVSGKARLDEGDRIIVVKQTIAGETNYFLSDVYRLHGLWILLAIFFVFVIALTKMAGLRSIISLCVSLFVVVFYLIPKILDGGSVLLVGFLTVLILASMSLFFSHGLNKRTTIAFAATIITVILSFLLAEASISMLHLFGLGSEEAFYVRLAEGVSIDLGVILILGIIVSVLGVLDDVTTTQATTIEELHKANPSLTQKELLKRGFTVGREHILSLVNTLVLVYTGASLPLLLLFHIYERPAWLVVNSELFIEEIVKILVASIALLIAIPVTTFIASVYYSKKQDSRS